jgi:uncharacterized protein (DUF58 family)
LEVTPFAAGVREYLSGDSLNQIHWPTSVRHDRLMVKEFDQDPQTDIWVFIDTFIEVQIQAEPRNRDEKLDQALQLLSLRPSKEQYEIPRNSIDYECIVGASIINHLILKNEAIGLAAYSNQIRIHQPEKGERHFIKILEELATLDGKSNWSISEMIQTLIPGLAKGTTLIIITPELSTSLTTTLDDISMRKMHPILIWINLSGTLSKKTEQEIQLRTILDHKIPVFEVPEIQVIGDLTRILRQNNATSYRNLR